VAAPLLLPIELERDGCTRIPQLIRETAIFKGVD
jgi:hypothetical protein